MQFQNLHNLIDIFSKKKKLNNESKENIEFNCFFDEEKKFTIPSNFKIINQLTHMKNMLSFIIVILNI